MSELKEGDLITVGAILGLYPDGQFIVDETAPEECRALWKVGKPKADGTLPVIMVKPGKSHNGGVGQRPRRSYYGKETP